MYLMKSNTKSRTTNSLRNAKVNLIIYALTILISFFSRKVFLDGLGDNFMGLMSILRNILDFLNLAELGIGWAVGVKLYKPLAENNREEIEDILKFCGYLYKKVGLTIVILGMLVSIGFPWFFDGTGVSFSLIYFCFYSFLTTLVLGYYLNYHQIILQADQKESILALSTKGIGLVKQILQLIAVILFKYIFLWILLDLLFGIFTVFLVRHQINSHYQWLQISLKNLNKDIIVKNKELFQNLKQVSIHKFSFFVLSGTDQILVYLFVNIQSVAFFANYQMLFGHITSFVNSAFSGAQASIGNLVAENDLLQIKKVYWEMMTLRFFVAGVIIFCTLSLIQPFILIWLGERYLLSDSVVYLLLITTLIAQVRMPNEMFINGYGLFHDVWAPIIEAIINLLVSIIFGYYFGIVGIILGTAISTGLITLLWKPYFLFTRGFKLQIIEFIKGFSLRLLIIVLSIIFANLLYKEFISQGDEFGWFLIQTLKASLLIIFIQLVLFYLFVGDFKKIAERFFKMFSKKN